MVLEVRCPLPAAGVTGTLDLGCPTKPTARRAEKSSFRGSSIHKRMLDLQLLDTGMLPHVRKFY